MIGFFPSPYPDELLYSVLARYYVWSADISPKATLKELFGKTSVVATFDLPSHIESLVQNLLFGLKPDAESFIQQNTLYPFYSPFLPAERAKIVFDSMNKHFSGDIHTRIGIMASAIPQIKFFRFCPLCLREDIEKYGEPYWHRTHQIAGVLVCSNHQVWLQNSSVKTQGDNRHEFYASDVENCIFKPSLVDYNKNTLNKFSDLSQDINEMLNQPIAPRSGEWFRAKYQSLLVDRGLATANGRVRRKDLFREFNNFYGAQFLRLTYSDIDFDNENNWLSQIARKHRKVFHPLRHLLFMRFSGQNISTFFESNVENKPFGEGNWTCFNGASKHYLEKVVTSVSVSYSRDVKKLVGTFSCSCGFAYSTSNASMPYSEKFSFAKIKSFGGIWERKLKKLLVEKRVSLREAARQLKVDTKTVIHHAERLNFISVKSQINNLDSDFLVEASEFKREKCREKWLKTRREITSLSKTELRKKLPGVFIWLYRHDREWLRRNSPRKKRVVYKNHRIDWMERDEQILNKCQNAAQSLLRQSPLIRITIGTIGKNIGLRALLEKNLDKLPRTKLYLISQIESVEQFQLRRVSWAVHKLLSSGEIIKAWQVMRLAGIKNTCPEMVKQAINNIVHEANLPFHLSQKTAS